VHYPEILATIEIPIRENMVFKWIPLHSIDHYLSIQEINYLDLHNNLVRAESHENKKQFVMILCNKQANDT